MPKPSPSPSKLTNQMNTSHGSPPSSNQNASMTSPLANKQPSMSNERNYNKSSGPRSGSQGSNQGNYGHSGYYSSSNTSSNPRPQTQPMGSMGSHYPPSSMHGYPPQGNYPPYYNQPPPASIYPPAAHHQRYPTAPYPPMGHQGMYPPAMQKPMGGMYNQPMGGMYAPMPNQLNQYEEQMFQEAYQLVN
jgi:hypothetical protein